MTKISTFTTNLGEINFTLHSNENLKFEKCDNRYICITKSFNIEIFEFSDIMEWQSEIAGFEIENSIGWIIRLIKTSNDKSDLKFQCVLSPKSKNVTSEPDTGESLLAVWIENETDVVSIGAEDGEMMRYRAEKNDWMPNRFKKELGYVHSGYFFNKRIEEKSFTELSDFGLKTEIPKLKNGEKFYFHYLVATNKLKKSKDYPDEYDISSNFAVDYPKWTLIKKLNIEE